MTDVSYEDYDDSLPMGRCTNPDVHDWHVVIGDKSFECMGYDVLPQGLCANKEDHAIHIVSTGSLAPYICMAKQEQREPYRSEQRRKV